MYQSALEMLLKDLLKIITLKNSFEAGVFDSDIYISRIKSQE